MASDALGSALAWRVMYYIRYESGLTPQLLPYETIGPTIALAIFWILLFAMRGMYAPMIALSRFRELSRTLTAALIGIGIIFVATFDVGEGMQPTRVLLLTYGALVFFFVGGGRAGIRTYERRLRWKRIGLRDALIVGFNDIGRKLHSQLYHFPVWGFNVVGFIDRLNSQGTSYGVTVLGSLDDLNDVLTERKIDWVLIAPTDNASAAVMETIDRCNIPGVRFMLVADHYQMVIGLVRTIEIHGLPLIEVHPQLVPIPTRAIKRVMDVVAGLFASMILLAMLPFIAFAIKLDSPGPVFYTQMRLGRRGKPFRLFKFRSMVQDAEKSSGAVWAAKNDPRVTRVGKILRKTHLDEFPQFLNVLLGQMSLVGPRPERKEFVEQLRSRVPLYERRLRVRPGITGWAQVRHKYDESLDDVIEKTRYDLFYIDNISIGLDLKIIFSTALRMVRGEGHA